MTKIHRQARLFLSVISALIPTVFTSPAIALATDQPPDWTDFAKTAKRFVAIESPSSVFPFKTAKAGLGKALVIAHYFPFFPISYEGLPPDKDYYAKEFLSVSGENGKHARQGGFLRERPLPTPFQSTPQFYDANFAIDVERAARIGIDGFGVNLLSLTDKTFMPAARKLLDAAVASSTGFKIFPEPDMTTLSGLTPLGLADTLMLFATHPGALRIDGKLLVMPIAAEKYPVAFWQQFTTIMSQRGYPIALMPCYYDPAIGKNGK